jgi:hypothetical protein
MGVRVKKSSRKLENRLIMSPPLLARVVKLADTLALEASAQKAWGFKSLREHQFS